MSHLRSAALQGAHILVDLIYTPNAKFTHSESRTAFERRSTWGPGALTPLASFIFRPERVNFMETDWPLDRGFTWTWLISTSSAAVPAVNHSDADRGRSADNADPFEVRAGRPPVP